MKKENLNNYKMKKEKKINILSIENHINDLIKKENQFKINELKFDIEKYQSKKENQEILFNYFKDYQFYISKNIYILKNDNEIIFIRNSKEREFFFKSHFDFYLKNKKENELIIDFERRLDEILIDKNYIIFDYKKYDFEIIENKEK